MRSNATDILWMLAWLLAVLAIFAAASGQATCAELKDLAVKPHRVCSDYVEKDYSYDREWAVKRLPTYRPYSDEIVKGPEGSDLEHIVSRYQAHVSGACAWPVERRAEFARDLLNQTLASPYVNREVKKAKDAEGWIPDHNRKWFCQRVIDVKSKWELSVDEGEKRALERCLG